MYNFGFAIEWGTLLGGIIAIFISIIGIRLLIYFHSFFLHWHRYRQIELVTNSDIRALPYIPFVKVQITTRGAIGSTEVIRRGIQNIDALVKEAPDIYRDKICVEVVTESWMQKQILEHDFTRSSMSVRGFAVFVPSEYQTPKGTRLKARSLHYMVELRRQGFNRKQGQTFIVHYDEESVMRPDELRKLVGYLATTDRKLTEGPIYYPLDYADASVFCRAMEANRPVCCYECRELMEKGTPLHLHGSNLVIEEALENELGWDIGMLDGQPFISEDYVFGVLAYLQRGPEIFGWHGCVMLEQPPLSFKSAFRQRYRWIVGVLQGITMMRRMPGFHALPAKMRLHLIWGTRYRVLTFALGLPTGLISLPYLLYQTLAVFSGREYLVPSLPLPIACWFIIVGFLWLNSIFIGAWHNLSHASQMSSRQRWIEGAHVLAVAPIASVLESSAAFWAVVQWTIGNRNVSWQPTPKTKQAEKQADKIAPREGITILQPATKGRLFRIRNYGLTVLVTALVLGTVLQWLLFSGSSPFAFGTGPSKTSDLLQIEQKMQRPEFQTGVAFPQWGSRAYSKEDTNWQVGLDDIRQQTGARWIELPINLYQPSLSSTQVIAMAKTPTPEAVAEGIHTAHARHYHVFMVPQLTVEGQYTWAGYIHYTNIEQTRVWFDSYWQALRPYITVAAQSGVEEVALGTEYELLQQAPASLWGQLIERVHSVFPGKLTYNMNWTSLGKSLPSWMSNVYLSYIGVSVYIPLTNVRQRLDPHILPALWKEKVKVPLDTLALQLRKPVLISEIGYRDTSDALYRPWETQTSAPRDLEEQMAAYNAALVNSITDTHIQGIFFWAWSFPVFEPNQRPAARVLYHWYTSPLA